MRTTLLNFKREKNVLNYQKTLILATSLVRLGGRYLSSDVRLTLLRLKLTTDPPFLPYCDTNLYCTYEYDTYLESL